MVENNTKYLIGRFYSEYIKKHSFRIAATVVLMIIVAASSALVAYLIKPVIDKIFINKSYVMLFVISCSILGTFLVKSLAVYGYKVLLNFIENKVVIDLQLSLYEHIINLDINIFNKFSSGKLISHFSNDINIIRNAFSVLIINAAKEVFTCIFLVLLMFMQSPKLSIISFIAFPIALMPISKLNKRLRKISRSTQEEYEKFISTLDDSFEGIRVIKSYGAESYEIKKFNKLATGIFNLSFKAFKVGSISSPLMEFLAGVAIVMVIGYGGMQVINGTTTAGSFFSFITAFLMVSKPARGIAGFSNVLQSGLVALERVFHILDLKSTIQDKSNAQRLNAEQAEITFEEVSFSYPHFVKNEEQDFKDITEHSIKPTLTDINFTVEPGKKVAFVGYSGGGKTTIANLLLRFYDVDSGSIKINNIDIRDITIASLRNSISFVGQDVFLFDDTIKTNICYGDSNFSDQEIVSAIKAANADEFIFKLPYGLDTYIGQKGIRLSGGQKQRIAIARAILKNSPILILDEATSALDNITEKEIQESLNELMKNRTSIIIAHRLSSIEKCDKIYVMSEGTIVECGTHEALIEQNGFYRKLYLQRRED